MKYLGWILLLVALAAGIILWNTKYLTLQKELDAKARETEMWISQTEQLKRQYDLGQTRQRMAPDVSLLLADVFGPLDSFHLTRWGQDTLRALAQELRRTRGDVDVSVYSDDSGAALTTKVKYPDSWALSAAKAAAVVRFLQAQGVPPERLVAQAFGRPRQRGILLPDLQRLSSRRLEITVHTLTP